MKRSLVRIACTGCLLCWTSVGLAVGTVDSAREHFRRGVELYEEADYATALVEFKRAYDLAPNPKIFYNMGQVCFELRNYVGALDAFERYLAEAEVSDERKQQIEKEIEKLRHRVARLHIKASVPGIRIDVDDVRRGETPLAEPLVLNAGTRKVVASKPGYKTHSASVVVAGGDDETLELRLTKLHKRTVEKPVGRTGPGPRPETDRPVPVLPWVVTGVLAAGAITTGILTLSAVSQANSKEGEIGVSRASLDDSEQRVRTYALLTDVLGGAAMVAGGVSLYLTLRPSTDDAPGSRAALRGIPSELQITGTF